MKSSSNHKLFVFGNYDSFKTKLLYQILAKQYDHKDSRVIGVDLVGNKVIDHHLNRLEFQLWDTSEVIRYVAFIQAYFSDAYGIVYVYEASSQESFEGMKQFLKETNLYGCKQKPKLLVGYVLDASKKVIDTEKGAAFAAENDMMFQELFVTDKEQVSDQMLVNFADKIFLRDSAKSIQNFLSSANKKLISGVAYQIQLRKAYRTIRAMNQEQKHLEQKVKYFTTREKMMSVEIQMLRSQNQLLEVKLSNMTENIKKLEKVLNPTEVDSLIEVIDQYEADNLSLKEQFHQQQKKMSLNQRKWEQQVRELQSICEEFSSITIQNISVKLGKIANAYSKYKLMSCKEEDISMAQYYEESKFSNILESLNRSSIYQFE